MTVQKFKESISETTPPDDLSDHAKSLWYDAKKDWKRAHEIIQDIEDKNASWIHAYLHREEGDISNADYWYHRAGKKRPEMTLEKEWEQIVTAML